MGCDIKDIGDRAYRARTSQRMKQSQVSDALGIAQSSYSRFENGYYDLPVSKAVALCEILDISLMWLLYGKKDDSDNV